GVVVMAAGGLWGSALGPSAGRDRPAEAPARPVTPAPRPESSKPADAGRPAAEVTAAVPKPAETPVQPEQRPKAVEPPSKTGNTAKRDAEARRLAGLERR